MKPLTILIWHVHGSYLNAIVRTEHDWVLPVKPDRSPGYIGHGETFDHPEWVREVPAEEIRNLDIDLIVYQSPTNLERDQHEILTQEQIDRAGKIYLEHNTPRPHPVDTRHLAADREDMLLVHVTHFNRLMWDNGRAPTAVIEHSVAIAPQVHYRGHLERGITIVNGMQKRPRIAGYDLFRDARQQVPIDIAGMETEEFGGLGDIPYRHLHSRMAEYRFLFSPIRYTSLPLAVIEGMTIGMPILALSTTELPTVIENGRTGYLSCELDELVDRMRFLLERPHEARRMGAQAREVALQRFGIDRFVRDWNAAFERTLDLRDTTSDSAGAQLVGRG